MEQAMPASPPVVYTALMGGYEELSEQPIAKSSTARFICYTDDPNLTSDTWEVVVTKPTLAWDSTRAARKVKILATSEVRAADTSLWIDNRVQLRIPPEDFVSDWLASTDMALPWHGYRTSVRDEFDAVISSGFDVRSRVREQLFHISQQRASVLDQRPYWTALLARRWTPEVIYAMEVWSDLVHTLSRRDQLSVNYALEAANLAVRGIEISNFDSPLHHWLSWDELPKRTDVIFARTYSSSFSRELADRILSKPLPTKVRNKIDRSLEARRIRSFDQRRQT